MCIPDVKIAKEKRMRLASQLREWLEPVRQLGLKVTCEGCKRRVNFWYMFRCLYCGFYFCKECADNHFK